MSNIELAKAHGANVSAEHRHADDPLIAILWYGLWRDLDGGYWAGCRGPLTWAQALEHWDRDDDRALLYTLAILFTE